MRDYQAEIEKRVDFLRRALQNSGARGFVFGNSGGKDCALVGILCRMASENTLSVIMPCESKRNFMSDKDDAEALTAQFSIKSRLVDLTKAKQALVESLGGADALSPAALTNIAPRLRMSTLYAIAATEGLLVAGTGNRSEYHMGYFTKWGDGAYDLNPIADLTATEVIAFLRYLKAPQSITAKAPSAGLFEGQTDEADMGVSYASIDAFLQGKEIPAADRAIVERYHNTSRHKRRPPLRYGDE